MIVHGEKVVNEIYQKRARAIYPSSKKVCVVLLCVILVTLGNTRISFDPFDMERHSQHIFY